MKNEVQLQISAYLPSKGREELLQTLEQVPEHKVIDLISHLNEVSKSWHPNIESLSYSNSVLTIKIGYTINSF